MGKVKNILEGALYVAIVLLVQKIAYYGVYLLALVGGREDMEWGPGHSVLVQCMVLLVLGLVRWVVWERNMEPFQVRRTSARNLLVGAWLGVGLVLLLQGAANLAGRFSSLELSVVQPEVFQAYPLAWWLLGIGVVVPIVEEMIYRGFFQHHFLRGFGAATAVLAQGLLFAVGHKNLLQGVLVFPMALLHGLLVWKTGSLLPAMVSHVTFNVVVLLMMALQMDVQNIGQLGVVFLGGVFMVYTGLRLMDTEEPKREGGLQ
ncbi:CPBP family intramembrane glutamic endopeptidase [Anaerotalea alkaliphila]|uniref:CPBP family intramembrane metalloprotease n=1 Tax=Anaerotalea alkaliphila TaxID=2662126 RepID=A0A7X5HU41_9FIRM|nr:CPBP family intramembrane glutamic endopeptidase [Anaerotalea alkaliphila]NDL66702.1 CPBP family intramembrane metalloprotease [Anaerotalea alkaliphila]